MISVIILTYNDEVQIEACLKSIQDLSDDIIIVDSQSADRSNAICEAYGAKVYQNRFINQAIQFNWALDNVPIKYKWVLRLDSDEVVPEKLKAEMKRRLAAETEFAAYYLNRRTYWMNRWMKHGRIYPHFIVRLFRKGKARYEEKTEEHLIVDGVIGKMENDFYEDNKKNNLDYFTEKHLQTARGELQEIQEEQSGADKAKPAIEGSLFGAKVHRTRWLKEQVYSRTPLFVRPFLYFSYRYFICLGFLDGVPGLIFHILQGFWYRFYIDAKVYESRHDQEFMKPVDYRD
jgi:glycosyltransferase involved in cell wall biosynthesis